MTLEVQAIIDYLDKEIEDARGMREEIHDMNCYAAGFEDARIEEFKRLRSWIKGE